MYKTMGQGWLPRRRAQSSAREQSGFSLVETVIAITIAAVMLTALGGVLTTSMLTGLFARQSQNAIDLASETLEGYRALGYQALAMDPNKIAGSDPELGGTNQNPTFDPGNVASPEPLARLANGAVDHQQAVTKGLTPYTVWSYVTFPVDAKGATYKRVTVRVTWTKNNALHERRATSFVSLVRRGLPLPNFLFGDPVERTFGQGTKVVLPVTIVNRGARDAWNLSATSTRAGWIISWYADKNADGQLDVGDTVLTDTDTDGVVDTGVPLVDTDESIRALAVVQLQATEPVTAGTPVEVTLKAVSSAQPGLPGTRTVLDKVHVTDGCVSCTYQTLFLHNILASTPPTTDTPAQPDMPVDTAAPTATTLYDYDTDSLPGPGRSIAVGGVESDDPPPAVPLTQKANWDYTVPATTKLTAASPVKVRLYATTTDPAATSAGTLTVFLRYKAAASSTFTTIGTTASSVALGASFQPVDLDIAISNLTLTPADVVEVRVVASGAAVLLAYDTTSYPAHLRLPVL